MRALKTSVTNRVDQLDSTRVHVMNESWTNGPEGTRGSDRSAPKASLINPTAMNTGQYLFVFAVSLGEARFEPAEMF